MSVVRAPAQLDASCQNIVKRLSQELTLPDKVLAAHLSELLEHIGDDGREIVSFVLLYDEVATDKIKVKGLSHERKREAIEKCISEGLLDCRVEVYGQGAIFIDSTGCPQGFATR